MNAAKSFPEENTKVAMASQCRVHSQHQQLASLCDRKMLLIKIMQQNSLMSHT